jgi:hypothetical protein
MLIVRVLHAYPVYAVMYLFEGQTAAICILLASVYLI